MKSRAKGGVVDHKMNVYGTSHLKLADLSICPDNLGTNTYSAALLCGEKCAQMIADDLGELLLCVEQGAELMRRVQVFKFRSLMFPRSTASEGKLTASSRCSIPVHTLVSVYSCSYPVLDPPSGPELKRLMKRLSHDVVGVATELTRKMGLKA